MGAGVSAVATAGTDAAACVDEDNGGGDGGGGGGTTDAPRVARPGGACSPAPLLARFPPWQAASSSTAAQARSTIGAAQRQTGPERAGKEAIIVMDPKTPLPGGDAPKAAPAIEPQETGKLPAGLYLVATPIGNLGDMTARAIATLRAADRIAAEDTRVARRLLAALAIRAPRLERHDDHADAAAIARLVAAIAAGEAVVLISDAGMPVIADPGYRLVRAVRAAGLAVRVVPGASAPLAALALSGLPSDRFFFAGFLPPRRAARRAALAGLAAIPATLVLLEAPQRLAESLADMAALLGAGRDAAIARELTKLFEELRTGTLADLAAALAVASTPKGEIVVVVAPPDPEAAARADDQEAAEAALDAALTAALERMRLSDAVAAVAGATGTARRVVYARALALGRRAASAGGGDGDDGG